MEGNPRTGALRRPNCRGRFQTCPNCPMSTEAVRHLILSVGFRRRDPLLRAHAGKTTSRRADRNVRPTFRQSFLRVQAYVWRSHFAPGDQLTCHSERSGRNPRSFRCKCERDLHLPIWATDCNQYKKEKGRGAGKWLRPFFLWMSVQMRFAIWGWIPVDFGTPGAETRTNQRRIVRTTCLRPELVSCPKNSSPFNRRFIPSRYVPLARRPYAGRLRSGALRAGRLGGRI